MADWGMLSGMRGLYAYPSKREAAREELATLKILSDEVRAEKEREEQNQIKVQEYQNQVKAFADSLLGPDRDKINEKARILGKNVQDMLRASGGDYTKFIENGGHNIMSEYQTSLMNSPEATTYLENRKNSELITNIIMSGKGDLIALRDMESFRNYQMNKGGKITYSGMLSEIDMPDPSVYKYGSLIPAEDILANKNNYVAIYGNYVLENPNAPKPTKQDLIHYVNSRYREYGKSTVEADQAYKNEMLQMQREKHNWDRMKAQAEIGKLQREAMRSPNPNAEKDGERTEFEYNTWMQLPNSLTGVTKDNLESALQNNGYWKRLSGNATPYTEEVKNLPVDEGGIFDFKPKAIGAGVYSKKYTPRGSYEVMKNYNPVTLLQHAVGVSPDQVDASNRTINNLTPQNHWYLPDGSTFAKSNAKLENYNGAWQAKSIITGWEVQNKDDAGTFSLMVNAKDKSLNEKVQSAYADSEAKLGLYVVVENEDGVTAYVPLPMSGSQGMQYSQALMSDESLSSMNVAQTVMDAEIKEARKDFDNQFAAQITQNTNNVLAMVSMNPQFESSINSESMQFSPTGNSGLRKDFIKSFYATISSGTGNDLINDYGMKVQGGAFGQFIALLKSAGYTDISNDLKSGYTDQQILNQAIIKLKESALKNQDNGAQETIDFLYQWMAAYPTVVNFKM